MSFFTEELFHWLLEHEESCWLDFKREIHSNKDKDELLKDILALANADHQSDRYLLFGIEDGNKKEIGLDLKETWLKKEENFLSWFRKCTFNHRPSVQFKFLSFEDKLFACLRIENQPYKPYFSTKDNTNDNHIIWTREDHTNQKADDGDMQRMWRERFGLDKSIKERFFLYLEDFENWTQTDDQFGCFYYNDFPEFTLVGDLEKDNANWEHTWTKKTAFPDKRISLSRWQFKYHTTLIESIWILGADGDRHKIPFPKSAQINKGDLDSLYRWYFSKESNSYKLALFFHNRVPSDINYHPHYSFESILKLTNLPIKD
ncbi:MAG: ATP-binding protein [Vampirovibrio sp.]|nr:ATP-binding protein [Vampirovibrio sp.]